MELDRDRDKPEHLQVAAAAKVPSKFDTLVRHAEVDAGHDVDAATCDAQVERDIAAELDRRLDLL
jgi:hypothetical protein